jgi:hypothetical protein
LTDVEINDIDTLNSRVNNKLQIYLHGNAIQCNCQTLKFLKESKAWVSSVPQGMLREDHKPIYNYRDGKQWRHCICSSRVRRLI